MTYILNDKHLENALAMPGPKRYEYFVKRVADWGTLYSLQSPSGWAVAEDKCGFKLLPVWPHKSFAELCKNGDWSDCITTAITLAEWFDDLGKTLTAESMKVTVFNLPNGRGVVVEPDRLSQDLREELSQLEDDE